MASRAVKPRRLPTLAPASAAGSAAAAAAESLPRRPNSSLPSAGPPPLQRALLAKLTMVRSGPARESGCRPAGTVGAGWEAMCGMTDW